MIERINNIIHNKSGVGEVDKELIVQGWIRTRRDTGSFSFLEVNDGSTLANLQVIADSDLENYAGDIKN